MTSRLVPYVAKIYFRNSRGKIQHFTIEKYYYQEIHAICYKFKREHGYQFQVHKQGNREIVLQSPDISYITGETEYVQKEMF